MATATDRISACEGVSARQFDGEWIVLDLQGGNYFGLDEIGGVIWDQLCAGRTPADIALVLVARYEIAEESALQDVIQLTDELVERGLVRISKRKGG